MQSETLYLFKVIPWEYGTERHHLRYFITVARERNFTRAAEKLCIARPPLSRQTHDLEAERGAALLDRDCRPVRLTEAERLFYEHATQVLERINDLCTMMRRFRNAERPRFVIRFVASTIYAALPNLIHRFRAATPGLDLSLVEMENLEQITAHEVRELQTATGLVPTSVQRLRRDDVVYRELVEKILSNKSSRRRSS
jgi:DNA-binding transcriptional LysR family regulator